MSQRNFFMARRIRELGAFAAWERQRRQRRWLPVVIFGLILLVAISAIWATPQLRQAALHGSPPGARAAR
jgi:hypothetical protein